MMLGFWGAPRKRRLADAHDAGLLWVPGGNEGLLMLMVLGFCGVPRGNEGLLMLMMLGFWGCQEETQAC